MLKRKPFVGLVAAVLLGLVFLLGRVLADDNTYWLDSDSDTCSSENDTADCPLISCSDGGAITCQSGDDYLDATLDKGDPEGGANTLEDEGNPVDCYKPVTCANNTHADFSCQKIPLLPAYKCVYGTGQYVGITCYDCNKNTGDPETEDEDVLGDCSEE